MNRISAGQPGPVKGADIGAYFALLPSTPPTWSTYFSASPNVIPQDRPKNARRRRFRKLLAFTFLILCTLWAFPNKLQTQYDGIVSPKECHDHARWEKVPDVTHGSGYRVHLHTSLTLPMSADVLSVIAQGSRTHGSLEVSQMADAGSDAIVDIDVFYRNQEDFDEATICRLHPSHSNEWGLRIFTRSWRLPAHVDSKFHHLLFNVHLRLPTTPSLRVRKLKTELLNFSQHFGVLADSVHFDKLAMKSTNGDIEVESVAGDQLELSATNGAIYGQFKTTSGLNLETSGGRIDAKVSLLPCGPDDKYTVWTGTSEAPISLVFIDASVDAPVDGNRHCELWAAAHTSNGQVDVTMHDTFEGAFDVWTSGAATPATRSREDVYDPAGQGRMRGHTVHTQNRNVVRGNVWWDKANWERGKMSLWTSNAAAMLTL